MSNKSQSSIVLFDGVCNLCNGAVQWIIKRDKHAHFSFASLQSEVGQELQRKFQLDPTTLDSIVLFTDDQVHLKSTAALKIGAKLGGLYKISSLLLFIPRVIRDGVYDFIARNRYRWFGRQEACLLPRPEWQSRFLG